MWFVKRVLFAILLSIWVLFAQAVRAEIVVDPNSTGATDVIYDPDGAALVLFNPVDDPLVLGSEWLYVGQTAAGALSVRDGGQLNARNVAIGVEVNSSGVVEVDGAGSEWVLSRNSSNLIVGHVGDGALSVTNGATVSDAQNASFGSGGLSHAQVLIQGAGSRMTMRSQSDLDSAPGTFWLSYFIGYEGAADFDVMDGGALHTTSTALAWKPGSSSIVRIDGAQSNWIVDGALYVGDDGDAQIAISNGGRIDVEFMRIGFDFLHDGGDGSGVVIVDGVGSVLSQDGEVNFFGVGGESNGQLILRNGGLATAGGIAVIDSEGTLAIDVGPDGAGTFDVTDDFLAKNGSTLRVSVVDGTVPIAGQMYTVVSADGGIGDDEGGDSVFSDEDLQRIAGDYVLDWAVHYNPNDITLEVVSSVLAADFDADGDVDGDDFLIWQSSFGLPIGVGFEHADGDADLDQDVDGDDFLIWQSQFGMSFGESALAAAPEPSSYIVFALASAACAILLRHRPIGSRS